MRGGRGGKFFFSSGAVNPKMMMKVRTEANTIAVT